MPREYLGLSRAEAEAIFEDADLLLNFHYAISPALLARFRRTALVDIDPGLLQLVTSMNLYGTVYCCNAVAPIMKRQRSGKIITVSSVAGLSPSTDGGTLPSPMI